MKRIHTDLAPAAVGPYSQAAKTGNLLYISGQGGINPETGKKVFVARNPHDKAMQRALMQYKNPKNRQLVKEALQQTNRGDLIGDDAKCLLKISSFHNPKARHSKIAFNPKINKRR